jgi:hypothetical protein
LNGESAWTVTTSGYEISIDTGLKSFTGSNGSLGSTAAWVGNAPLTSSSR